MERRMQVMRSRNVIFTICAISAFVVSCKTNVETMVAKQLPGSWYKVESTGKRTYLRFGDDGHYEIDFGGAHAPFTGEFSYSGDAFKFVDRYCGTSLPGIYRIACNGKELELTLLDDPKCHRNRIFPGVWKRGE